MLPSLTTYGPAEIRTMSPGDKVKLGLEIAQLRTYVDELATGSDLHETLAFARWMRSVERPLRSVPVSLFLDYQELALRSDRAVGLVMEHLRNTGMLARRGTTPGGDNPPPLSWHGIDPQDIPRHARYLSNLDPDAFEAAIVKGRTDRSLSGAHVQRVLNGQAGTSHVERITAVAEMAARGSTSTEIARALGFRDGHNVRALAERNEIDIPADRTAAAQMRSRQVTRSASGFTERNYLGLSNALSALNHVMTEAGGQLHPDITTTQAASWAKDLRRGRAQLTRLINELQEAATP